MPNIRFIDSGTPVGAYGIPKVDNATSSSFATSASFASTAITASHALFAVSASVEITKEVSSSHANRADVADSGNGIFSGSFSGSYEGNGSGLTNIPASGIVGLNLSQIASGSATASISPDKGFQVNINTQITGSTNISGSLIVHGAFEPQGNLGNSTSVVIGKDATASGNGISIGKDTSGNPQGVSIGVSSVSGQEGVSIGYESGLNLATGRNINIGTYAQGSGQSSIMLNSAAGFANTNTTPYSFGVYMTSTATPDFQVTNTHITASGNISGSSISTASFGTYLGDGSQLSGITPTAGSSAGRVVFTTTNGELTAESGFEYDSATDQLTVQSLNVVHLTSSFITASTIQTSGSNIFGDDTTDTQTLIGTTKITGSAEVDGNTQITGSLTISGSVPSGSVIYGPTNDYAIGLGNDIFVGGAGDIASKIQFKFPGTTGGTGYIGMGSDYNNTKLSIRKGNGNILGLSAGSTNAGIGWHGGTMSFGQSHLFLVDSTYRATLKFGNRYGQPATTDGTGVIQMLRSGAPTTNITDCMIIYAGDSDGAGTVSPHFRTEDGRIISLGKKSVITGSLIVSSSVVDFTGATAISGSTFSGSFQGDGSQLTGIEAGTNLTQSIFVTQNGDDITGTIGDITKPFATLESASQAATTGSIIFVYPGTYTVEANYNLAKPGLDYYFYPNTTVSKSTAGDMFTMPAGTAGCNVYGQADFILGSSAGSLVQGNYQNNNYSYEFECRDIFSDSSISIVDTYSPDSHIANWKFRIMSSSAGHGFYQQNIYTDGILNIDCQEIITKEQSVSTFNGFRGGIVKARIIKSTNSFAFISYAAPEGLTLLVDFSSGVGGDNGNCAMQFTNQGTHTIIGDTTGIQLGANGGVTPFSGTINHTGRCGALAIEGLSGNYNGSAVARCDAFSNGASSNGVVKFNWTPAGSATDDYLKVHEGTVLATWIGQGGGYSNTIQVTGGKLVLDGYGKDQHAFKGWSVSGGEFILAGIFDKFHNNGNNYGQNQALAVSGGVCKITGTINTSPHLGDSNQKLINYTGGKLILDGATLITTGSYPVFDLDQDREVHIFAGGVNTNQTGSNGLLQASGSGYSLTNPLGGMIIEDASVE